MAVGLDQFTKGLSQSGLMSSSEARELVERVRAERSPKDSVELAEELVRRERLTNYQASVLVQGKPRQLVLGSYVLLDRIGSGGMGEVYKAVHQRMERDVALKLLPEAFKSSDEAVRRFEREVKAAARLSHTNIVTAHDAGEHDGHLYLVMEYVDGEDLQRAVQRRGPLPIDATVEYIRQAATGLAYAHEQGLLHRDVKPSNLLVSADGTVKVLDMGISRFTSGGDQDMTAEELTGVGHVIGTCEYMAPEQATNPKLVDERADIYSLGCTLYYLLTGHTMYRGENAMQTIFAHADRPIPYSRDARPEVPERLDEIMRRMVAKRREDRYATMSEVVRELEAFAREMGYRVAGGSEGAGSYRLSPLPAEAGPHDLTAAPLAPLPTPEPASEETLLHSSTGEARDSGRRQADPAPEDIERTVSATSLPWRGLAFLATVLAIVLAGWFVVQFRRAEQQQQAVEAVRGAGGDVLYDYEFADGAVDAGGEPRGPHWLRELLGIDFMQDVASVNLSGNRVSEEDMRRIGRLTGLELLDLTNTAVDDDAMKHVAGLEQLKWLYLGGTRVGDAGLVYLRELPALEVLHLRGTDVTDLGLVNLYGLDSLRRVELPASGVSAEGVRALQARIPRLTVEW